MTKQNLIKKLFDSDVIHNLRIAEAEDIVNFLCEEMVKVLENGESVHLGAMGAIKIKLRKDRMAVINGRKVFCPAKYYAVFAGTARFNARINSKRHAMLDERIRNAK